MSVVVNTSLSASGTPASGDGSDSPPMTASSTRAASASACSSATCRNAWYFSSVSCDLIQARPRHLDRRHLPGGDLGAQRGRVEPNHLAHSRLPQNPRDGEPAVDGLRRLGQRLLLGQARLDDVGAEHVDVLERIVGRFDAGDVDGLDLADVFRMASSWPA